VSNWPLSVFIARDYSSYRARQGAEAVRPKIAIDALWRWCYLLHMAYTIRYGGIPIECDTADDAIAIAQRLASENGSGPRIAPLVDGAEASPMERLRLHDLFDHLSEHQQRLVLMIGTHPKGVSASALNKAMGFEGNITLGAHLSNISRNAKKHGLSVADLWTRRVPVSGGKKGEVEFKPSMFLRLEAKDLQGEKLLPSKTA